jgi:hypothetical protein
MSEAIDSKRIPEDEKEYHQDIGKMKKPKYINDLIEAHKEITHIVEMFPGDVDRLESNGPNVVNDIKLIIDELTSKWYYKKDKINGKSDGENIIFFHNLIYRIYRICFHYAIKTRISAEKIKQSLGSDEYTIVQNMEQSPGLTIAAAESQQQQWVKNYIETTDPSVKQKNAFNKLWKVVTTIMKEQYKITIADGTQIEINGLQIYSEKNQTITGYKYYDSIEKMISENEPAKTTGGKPPSKRTRKNKNKKSKNTRRKSIRRRRR